VALFGNTDLITELLEFCAILWNLRERKKKKKTSKGRRVIGDRICLSTGIGKPQVNEIQNLSSQKVLGWYGQVHQVFHHRQMADTIIIIIIIVC
jgi:hypothetical protein